MSCTEENEYEYGVFHTTSFWVNMTVSLYTLCLALMQMVYGPLTDSIGRRKVLLFGNFIYLAATLGCYITAVSVLLFIATASHSLLLLLASDMLFGFFVGVSLPVQTVLLTSAFLQKRATAVGVYNFLRYMGMTLGPMAGSLLLHLAGLPAAFGFAALLLVGCGWRLGRAETSASR
ncbi:MFS transporter [Paenibacillus ginsengarvi]|uniref:MFS transporter n=1 Tax=Paenibacillus ginsengarvi TaxID=400777 RepID=A0A3B0BF73_9BACL|nr:MFS transporter [Paenibacillus ginsengarvi]RKN71863.1 MFS transporter [Paenibacillus ginsengarvi]